MQRAAYLGVLALILIGSGWLELFLRTRVFRRWLRLLLSVLPGLVVFIIWDVYAIASGHWDFDPDRVTGLTIGIVPIEEILFFVIIPIASVLTLEAVRSVKRWPVGDEP